VDFYFYFIFLHDEQKLKRFTKTIIEVIFLKELSLTLMYLFLFSIVVSVVLLICSLKRCKFKTDSMRHVYFCRFLASIEKYTP